MNEELSQTLVNSPTHQLRSLIIFWGWLAVITGTILILVIIYWLNYPYKPLEFTEDKFKVLTPVVEQGGTLKIISSYCKHMNLSATMTRTYENGLVFTTPALATNREFGCHTITVIHPIPQELPPGVYYLKNIYTYKVNPIREIVLTHTSEKFTVTESATNSALRKE